MVTAIFHRCWTKSRSVTVLIRWGGLPRCTRRSIRGARISGTSELRPGTARGGPPLPFRDVAPRGVLGSGPFQDVRQPPSILSRRHPASSSTTSTQCGATFAIFWHRKSTYPQCMRTKPKGFIEVVSATTSSLPSPQCSPPHSVLPSSPSSSLRSPSLVLLVCTSRPRSPTPTSME